MGEVACRVHVDHWFCLLKYVPDLFSQTLYWTKKGRCQRAHSVWFNLHDVQENVKLIHEVKSQNNGYP